MTPMLTQYSFSFVSVGVIVAAVRDWSDGRYTKAGCNLKFILDWAWARVVEIKVRFHSHSQCQS